MTGIHGPRPSSQPLNSGCLSKCPYRSTVSAPVGAVAGISIQITDVRPSSRTISTVNPAMARARHQSAMSVVARSMWPCSRQRGSKLGDLLGMRM